MERRKEGRSGSVRSPRHRLKSHPSPLPLDHRNLLIRSHLSCLARLSRPSRLDESLVPLDLAHRSPRRPLLRPLSPLFSRLQTLAHSAGKLGLLIYKHAIYSSMMF